MVGILMAPSPFPPPQFDLNAIIDTVNTTPRARVYYYGKNNTPAAARKIYTKRDENCVPTRRVNKFNACPINILYSCIYADKSLFPRTDIIAQRSPPGDRTSVYSTEQHFFPLRPFATALVPSYSLACVSIYNIKDMSARTILPGGLI